FAISRHSRFSRSPVTTRAMPHLFTTFSPSPMCINQIRFLGCLIGSLVLLGQSLSAQSVAGNNFAVVAPFLDDQTLLVARLDVRQMDPAALVSTLARLAPPDDQEFPRQLAGLEQKAKAGVQVLE